MGCPLIFSLLFSPISVFNNADQDQQIKISESNFQISQISVWRQLPSWVHEEEQSHSSCTFLKRAGGWHPSSKNHWIIAMPTLDPPSSQDLKSQVWKSFNHSCIILSLKDYTNWAVTVRQKIEANRSLSRDTPYSILFMVKPIVSLSPIMYQELF